VIVDQVVLQKMMMMIHCLFFGNVDSQLIFTFRLVVVAIVVVVYGHDCAGFLPIAWRERERERG